MLLAVSLGSPATARRTMASRSSKLEWAEPPLSGWVPTGATSTWSSASRVMAARAIAM